MSVRVYSIRIHRAMLIATAAGAVVGGGALCATLGNTPVGLPYIYTEAPRYDPKGWLAGRDRFPSGATLQLVSAGSRRALAPNFFAAADAYVSYDAGRVLFAGKRTATAHWQIWEVALAGGSPVQLTHCPTDCIRPLYLPTQEVVYTRVEAAGSAIEVSGKRLTFAPGRYLTDDVLNDGRILFEAERAPKTGELYTVYPDGTGVESLRCDHGRDRGEARQIASGDEVFRSGLRLGRFTSALATQTEVAQPAGAGAGPIAEIVPGQWLISQRERNGRFALYRWDSFSRRARLVEKPAHASAVEPVVVAARTPPREFPSALVPTRTAGNLLCLNARTSRTPIDGAAVRSVRAYTQDAKGRPALLGETEVESDGSFYIQVPADRPLRLQLADAAGHIVRAEPGWFWMRPSEQRICVGCHTGPERAPENKVPEILLRTIAPVKMLEVHP